MSRFDITGVGDVGLPDSYNRWLYRVRRRAFGLAIRPLNLRVDDFDALDVGSGTGFYIERWLERGPRTLVGSDLTQTAVIHLGKQFPNVEFERCDIAAPLSSTLSTRVFDVVSAMDVLFHITDDDGYQSAIDNLTSLVKSDGRLIFSDNLVHDRLDVGHQVSRTESYVRDLLQRRGFVIERIVPMFGLMNDPIRSSSKTLRKFFYLVAKIASRSEVWGNIVGALLFLPEWILVSTMNRGPSTEVIICRRSELGESALA